MFQCCTILLVKKFFLYLTWLDPCPVCDHYPLSISAGPANRFKYKVSCQLCTITVSGTTELQLSHCCMHCPASDMKAPGIQTSLFQLSAGHELRPNCVKLHPDGVNTRAVRKYWVSHSSHLQKLFWKESLTQHAFSYAIMQINTV